MSDPKDPNGGDEPGMGIVRRRRSRRLLETRGTASKPDGARGTTNHAAQAWGGLLDDDGGLSDEALKGDEKPTRPYRTVDMPKPRQRIIEPDPTSSIDEAIEQRLHRPSSKPPPKAQMRGVPLSNRPGAVAPPEEEARAARISEAPRKRISQPISSSIPPKQPPATSTPPPTRKTPPSDRPTPQGGVKALIDTAEYRFDLPPNAVLPKSSDFDDDDATRVVRVSQPPPESAPPRRRKRTIFAVGALALLFLGACVWSGAILFDEMERSARLNRVADALDSRVARIVEDNPQLSSWVKNRDAAQIKALREAHLPRLRETLTATGYAAGVPKVDMRPDAVAGRLIVQVNLPDAVLALNSDGDWESAPPRRGLGPALAANLTPILIGFSVPVLVALGMGIAARRRRNA
jgi:hypothetical protein